MIIFLLTLSSSRYHWVAVYAGLCTRFATQITFRRSAVESIAVSIIPAQDASPDHAAAVSGWGGWGNINMQSFNAETFAAIMLEVSHTLLAK